MGTMYIYLGGGGVGEEEWGRRSGGGGVGEEEWGRTVPPMEPVTGETVELIPQSKEQLKALRKELEVGAVMYCQYLDMDDVEKAKDWVYAMSEDEQRILMKAVPEGATGLDAMLEAIDDSVYDGPNKTVRKWVDGKVVKGHADQIGGGPIDSVIQAIANRLPNPPRKPSNFQGRTEENKAEQKIYRDAVISAGEAHAKTPAAEAIPPGGKKPIKNVITDNIARYHQLNAKGIATVDNIIIGGSWHTTPMGPRGPCQGGDGDRIFRLEIGYLAEIGYLGFGDRISRIWRSDI